MGLLIMNEKMPERCEECPCFRHDSLDGVNAYQCNVTLRSFSKEETDRLDDHRPTDCPLMQVPQVEDKE